MSKVDTKQYLGETTLKGIDTSGDYEPISTDSYNEAMIMESVKKVNAKSCFALALQFSVVGMGGKAYGKIMVNNVEQECVGLANKNGVKIGNKLNDKLQPGELTIKRLSRFFRYHIRDFMRETGKQSYLYRKYCDDSNADSSLVFPGAEHMVEGKEA